MDVNNLGRLQANTPYFPRALYENQGFEKTNPPYTFFLIFYFESLLNTKSRRKPQ